MAGSESGAESGAGADSPSPSDSTAGRGSSADDDVIDWMAVMGSPEVPTASLDQGRSTRSGRSAAGRAQSPPVDDDDEISIPMRRIASIAVVLVVLYLLVTFVDVVIASRSEFEGEATAAVVLGAAQYNGEPSPALAGRLDQAGSLYLGQRVELVVVTGGGQADDLTTEAKTGYDYLRDTASIPDEDLRLEVDGDSTYSSLAATARFLAQEGVTDVVLVTDPYHARRSKLIAEEVGLTASVSPTDASSSVPRLIRETGAVAVGRLVGFRRFDAYIDI